MSELLPIATITADAALNCRVRLCADTVEEYAQVLVAEGWVFPPLLATVDDDGTIWLWDGFHRLAAARSNGTLRVPVDLEPGSRRDAQIKCCGANRKSGLRRTRDDLRRAIRILLDDEEWSTWSSPTIATVVGCAPTTVSRLRANDKAAKTIVVPWTDAQIALIRRLGAEASGEAFLNDKPVNSGRG